VSFAELRRGTISGLSINHLRAMAGLFSGLRDLLGRPLWTFNPDELAADFRGVCSFNTNLIQQ